MKICVCHNLKSGGAKRALEEICSRLSLKHNIADINLNFTAPKNFLLTQYFIYKYLKNKHKKIAQKINESNFDFALVSHDYLTKSPYILRFLKIPSIYLCQESFREFYEPCSVFRTTFKAKVVDLLRLPLKTIDEENVKHASKVLANSKYSQNYLKKIYHRDIEYLNLGVDSNKFKWKHSKREKFFLSVGALAKFKGMDFLIRAIAKLPKDKQWPLYIVANGGRDENYIIKLARDLGVKLVIKRNVDDGELVELYNKALLFLFAPYYEPFGLVVLEAMACGLPVVGIDEGGLKETIIPNKNGWLSERNVTAFSKTIIKAINTVNNNFRKQTVYTTNHWTWEKTSTQIEKIITRLIL